MHATIVTKVSLWDGTAVSLFSYVIPQKCVFVSGAQLGKQSSVEHVYSENNVLAVLNGLPTGLEISNLLLMNVNSR